MAKGNKKRTRQFKGEYGLYFVFVDKVFNKISQDKNIPLQQIKDFAVIYYIQKYMIGGSTIQATKIYDMCVSLQIDMTLDIIRRRINVYHDMGLTDFYGYRHHFNKNAIDFLKSYAYWFHFNMVNFYNVIEEGKSALRDKARDKRNQAAKRRYRRKKMLQKT